MKEAYDSRNGGMGQSNAFDLVYFVMYDDLTFLDELVATDYALANKPLSYKGLDYLSYKIKQVVLGMYEFTLNYGTNQYQTTTGTSSLQFTVGGGSIRVTNSLSHTNYRHATLVDAAMDFKGAVGVELSGNSGQVRVNGVDVFAPILEYSYQSLFENDVVTDSYVETIFNLCGRINNAPFNNRAAGTVLFKGAHGSRKGDDKWEISFDFAYSPNASNLAIGDITVTTKKGWDYLDVIYVPNGKDSKGFQNLVPGMATVHKVYPDGNFNLLGISA